MAIPATTLAAALAHYRLDTRNRPLRMVLGQPGATGGDTLLPQCVSATESVCGSLELQILCLSESATLSLKDFIGVPCELQIVTDRGGLRRLCGIVTVAASGHSDGGLATYKLTVRDALSVMDAGAKTRVFRDKNELEIIELILKEWQRNNRVIGSTFDFQIAGSLFNRQLPKRAFTLQLDESDAAFMRRLMQRRGIAWFFQPGMGSKQGQAGDIGHTLVLFDNVNQLACNAAGTIRFHRDAATEERDAITLWNAERTLVPGQMALNSWDYLNPASGNLTSISASHVDQGRSGNALAATLEQHHITAPHLGDNRDDLLAISDARMAHLEFVAKCFHGEGAVRDLAVGEWFGLTGHPEIDTHRLEEREFVVTAQRLCATNNLPGDIGAHIDQLFARNGWEIAQRGDTDRPLRYRSSFTCVRRGVRIVPPPPVIPQPQLQSAIVVGPKDESVWCDHLGRVKIRFPATRTQDHAHADGAGASNSDTDSAWVRVASGWAGNGLGAGGQCGARLLPPVGAEVLVAFAGGDPDKPVIISQVYNRGAPPPEFRREDGLPANRYQSGLRSSEIRGQRGNQLRLDDTSGQISAQLASDHASSELNLGFLTEPRKKGSASARGEGAELRTEEAIALHAARGILLSAWKLLGGGGDKGAQLARDDYLVLLRDCGELCASLGNYAAEHHGLAIDTAEQEALLARFTGWEDGSNTRPQAAAPGEAVIAVTAPAGIGFASAKAVVSYAGTNVDTVAQQHMQLTAGQRFSVNAGKGLSLFAHHGGLHAIAHNGKLLMQSQHDDTAIESAKNMQLTATEGTVTVTGKIILLVAADGSFLKLGDGPPVLGSKAPIQFHAPDYTFDGPESMAAQLPDFGAGGADQKLELRYPRGTVDDDGTEPLGAPVQDLKMRVSLSDGTTLEGVSDAQGKSELLARDAMHMAEIALSRGGEQ
ncbi:type VI secretion system Vgr family protein [Massilia aurea]|uniref:type VI secretion system Vgr family protein n=1 Tax=Massilia aurea TaxID=373040 RepID=UPI0034624BC7